MITVFVVRPDHRGESHEFLQLHRARGDYMGQTWQIIRGGVEPDESYVAAALREMHEESGLVPVDLYRLGSVESFYTSFEDTLWHSVPFCAFIERSQTVRLNDEHDDFRWVGREAMESALMWASERALLNDLFHDILDAGIAKPLLQIPMPES